MKGCLAGVALLVMHFAMSLVMWLSCGWFSGDPLGAWPVFILYWGFLFRHWRMGSQYMTNAAVLIVVVNVALGWVEWRQPASIAIAKHRRGAVDQAFSILDTAIQAQPSSPAEHLARFQIAESQLDATRMRTEASWFRASAPGVGTADLMDAEIALLEGPPPGAAALATSRIERYPATPWYKVLRGEALQAAGDLDAADADFRNALAGYDAMALVWLRRPVIFVEMSYQSAVARMGLAHSARLRGDHAEARRQMEDAVRVLRRGATARDGGAPGAYALIPREIVAGNLAYAWAEALARADGDAAAAERLAQEARATLTQSRRNLTAFVERHRSAGTAPTHRQDIEAVRDAPRSTVP